MSQPTIIAGPAIVEFDDHVYYSEGDIVVNTNPETWTVTSAIFGDIDERLIGLVGEIQLTPGPRIGTDITKYWPYGPGDVGTQVFSGKPVVIHGKDGEKVTYPNGAITGLPTFQLSAIRPPWSGNLTLTVLGNPDDSDPGDADYFAELANEAFSDDDWDGPADTPRYTASFGGASPSLTGIEAEEAFLFDLNPSWSNKNLANWGRVNQMLTGLTAAARFAPAGITTAQFFELARKDATQVVPGESMAKGDNNLIVSGGGLSVTLSRAGPTNNTLRYGLDPLRHGEIAFVSRKTWTNGAVQPLFTFTLPNGE